MKRIHLFSAAFSLLTVEAFARDPSPPLPPFGVGPREDESNQAANVEHYGLQSAAFDAASFGIGSAALVAKSEPLAYLSLGTYLLGSPIVHLAHGEPGRALGSLGLRAAVPAVTGFVGFAASNAKGFGALVPLTVGIGVGVAIAAVIDDVFIAQREMKAEATVTFSPGFDPFKKEANINVSGTF